MNNPNINKFLEKYRSKNEPVSDELIKNFKEKYAAKKSGDWINRTSSIIDKVYSELDTNWNKYMTPEESKQKYDPLIKEISNLLSDQDSIDLLIKSNPQYKDNVQQAELSLAKARKALETRGTVLQQYNTEDDYKKSPHYYYNLQNNDDFEDKSKKTEKQKLDDAATKYIYRDPLDWSSNELTDEEEALYSYIYNTQGKDAADKFKTDIYDLVQYRSGKKIADETDNIGEYALTALLGGLERFTKGMQQITRKDPIKPTQVEIANALTTNKLSGIGKVAYELGTTISNMIPPILLGKGAGAALKVAGVGAATAATAGSATGSAIMGTSAGGNAINEALMNGYTNKQATLYGIMVGSLEAGLQYLLSSVTGAGSGLSSRFGASVIKNINNAFVRASVELGAGMVGEGVEEYMQDIINPLLRNIALGEKNEFRLVTEEALYSALLGALSAGILEGPGIVGSTRTYESYMQAGQTIIDNGRASNIIDAGLMFGDKSNLDQIKGDQKIIAKQIADKAKHMKANPKNVTSLNVGELSALINDYLKISKVEREATQTGWSLAEENAKISPLRVQADLSQEDKKYISEIGAVMPKEPIAEEVQQDNAQISKPVNVPTETVGTDEYIEAVDNKSHAYFDANTSKEIDIVRYEADGAQVYAVQNNGENILIDEIMTSNKDDSYILDYGRVLSEANADVAIAMLDNYDNTDSAVYSKAFETILESVVYGYELDELKGMAMDISSLPEAKIDSIYKDLSKALNTDESKMAIRESLDLPDGNMEALDEDYEPKAREIGKEQTEEEDSVFISDDIGQTFIKKLRNSREGGGKYIVTKDKDFTKEEALQYTILETIGQRFGLKFFITDEDIGVNTVDIKGEYNVGQSPSKLKSFYEENSDAIFLDASLAKNGMLLQYASMEAFNYLMSVNPDAAEALKEVLIERAINIYGQAAYNKWYNIALSRTITNVDAENYIASAFMMDAFASENFLNDTLKAKPKLYIKLIEIVESLEKWLKAFMEFIRKATAQIRVSIPFAGGLQRKAEDKLKEDSDFLEGIHKTFIKFLDEAASKDMRRKVSFIEQRIVGLETGDIDAGYVNEEMIPNDDGSYYGVNINSHRGLANATETREPADSEVVDIDMPPEEIDMAFAEYEKTEYTIDDFRKEYSLYPTEQMEKDLAERVAKIREELKSKKKEAVKTRELVLDADGNVTSVSSEHYVSPLEDYWDNIRKLSKYKERRKGVSIVHESGYVPTLYSNGSAVLLDAFGIGLGVKFIITNRPIGRNSTAGMYFPGTNYILLRDMPHRSPILQTAGHEIFHYLYDVNKKSGTEIKNSIISLLKKQGKYKEKYEIASKIWGRYYNKNTPEKTRQLIEEEIAAESFLELFENKYYIKEFAEKYGRETLYYVQEALDYMIRKIDEAHEVSMDLSLYKNELFPVIEDKDKMTELHHKIMNELDKSKDMPLKHLYSAEDEIKKHVERNNRNYVLFPEETMARELPDVKIFDKYNIKQIHALEDDMSNFLKNTKYYKPTERDKIEMYNDIASIVDTKFSRAEFIRRMDPVFNAIEEVTEQIPRNFLTVTSDVVTEMIWKAKGVDATMHDYIADGINYIRNTRIMFNQAEKEQIADRFDSFNQYRKTMFGWTIISNNGTPAREVWNNIREMYPDVASLIENTNDNIGEMIYEFVEMSRPLVINANDAYQLSVNDLAYELSARVFSKYLEIGTRKMVDKEKVAMQEKIDHLNQRINNIRKYYIEKRKNDYVNYQRLKKEATDKIKDEYRKKEVRQSIRKHYKDLYKMINKPTRNKHIPASLIKPISYIMSQIDLATEPRNYKFVTKNEKYFSDTLSKLSTMLENVDMNKEIDSLDMPKNIVSNLKDFALEVMNFNSVAGMNLEQLKRVRDILRDLKHIVSTVNVMVSNKKYATVREAAEKFIEYSDNRIKKTPKPLLAISNFFEYSLADSFTYGNKLGEVMSSLIDSLYRGSLKRTNIIEEAIEWFKTEIDPYLTKEMIDNSKPTDYEIGGGTISLTRSQIMDLYNLNKREQARKHIYNGGIFSDIEYLRRGRGSEGKSYVKHNPTEDEVKNIISTLSPEEIVLADKMQQFIEIIMGGHGNKTSMELFGYNEFMAENAYPITAHKGFVKSKKDRSKIAEEKAKSLAAVNQSFTKETKDNAQNPIVIRDIFDVLTSHVIGMASYCGYSGPLIDINNWLDYSDGNKSVKLTMSKAYGDGAYSYITRLIEDINGESKLDGSLVGFSKAIGNYKAAAVGMNLRVAIQQPSAYMRALAVVDGDVLLKAMAMKPAVKEMHKYSTIGRWKAYGFLENSLGISMKKLIVGFEGDTPYERFKSRVTDWSLFMPQKLDDVTWGALWNAARLQVSKNTDYETDSEEYMNEVNELHDRIIRETQVVDTIFHKPHFMRNKDLYSKITSAFLSEPLKMYNQILRSIDNLSTDNSPENRKYLARNSISILIQVITNCSLKSVVDMIRDDDDEKWIDKYLQSLKSNLMEDFNPLQYIPYLREVLGITKGFDASRFDMQGVQYMYYGLNELMKIWKGEGGEWLRVFNNLTKGASYLAGIPFNSLWRDVSAIYTAIYGKPYDSLLYREKYGRMYEYIEEGKTARYDEYVNNILKEGKTMNDIYTGLGTALFENDPNITVLAELKRSGEASQYERLFNEMVNKGYPFDSVNKAVNKYLNTLNESSTEKSLSQEDFGSVYDTKMLIKEIEDGDISELVKIKEDMMKNGKDMRSLKISLSSYFKDKLKELNDKGMTAEVYRIREILVTEFDYKRSDIANWLK